MQYILTEMEYQLLKKEAKENREDEIEIINKLCQIVSDNLPITEWPGTKENPVPWGCKNSSEDEWYCDNCPVDHYCNMPKEWSK